MRDASHSEVRGAAPGENTPIGTGSRQLLSPGLQHGVAIHLPNTIEDLNPEEMVATVGAGTPVSRLLQAVGEHQLIPSGIQPDEKGTVGGLFSDPREGPCDSFTGRFRDHVLGIEGVRGDGSPILSGGQVVKNVTGYDLTRLLGGAMGALGIVTRLHLRLERTSPCWGLVSFSFHQNESSWDQLDLIRCLPFEPYMILLEPAKQRVKIVVSGTQGGLSEVLQMIEDLIPDTDTGQVSFSDVVEIHRQSRVELGAALRIRAPWKGWRKIVGEVMGSWHSIFPSAGYGILKPLSTDQPLGRLIEVVSKSGGSVSAEDALSEENYQVPLVHVSPVDTLTRRLRREWDPDGLLFWMGDHR